MLTTDQKATQGYKRDKGVADTKTEKGYFEEPLGGRVVYGSDIWLQDDKIPSAAPVLSDGDSLGVVTYHEKKVLSQFPGSSFAFSSPALKNAVPFNWGDGSYNIKVYDGNNDQLPYGYGDYEIDNKSGILRFYSGTLPVLPVSVSFYQYIGNTGLNATDSPTVYVSGTGSDFTGTGTLSSPYRTLEKAKAIAETKVKTDITGTIPAVGTEITGISDIDNEGIQIGDFIGVTFGADIPTNTEIVPLYTVVVGKSDQGSDNNSIQVSTSIGNGTLYTGVVISIYRYVSVEVLSGSYELTITSSDGLAADGVVWYIYEGVSIVKTTTSHIFKIDYVNNNKHWRLGSRWIGSAQVLYTGTGTAFYVNQQGYGFDCTIQMHSLRVTNGSGLSITSLEGLCSIDIDLLVCESDGYSISIQGDITFKTRHVSGTSTTQPIIRASGTPKIVAGTIDYPDTYPALDFTSLDSCDLSIRDIKSNIRLTSNIGALLTLDITSTKWVYLINGKAQHHGFVNEFILDAAEVLTASTVNILTLQNGAAFRGACTFTNSVSTIDDSKAVITYKKGLTPIFTCIATASTLRVSFTDDLILDTEALFNLIGVSTLIVESSVSIQHTTAFGSAAGLVIVDAGIIQLGAHRIENISDFPTSGVIVVGSGSCDVKVLGAILTTAHVEARGIVVEKVSAVSKLSGLSYAEPLVLNTDITKALIQETKVTITGGDTVTSVLLVNGTGYSSVATTEQARASEIYAAINAAGLTYEATSLNATEFIVQSKTAGVPALAEVIENTLLDVVRVNSKAIDTVAVGLLVANPEIL